MQKTGETLVALMPFTLISASIKMFCQKKDAFYGLINSKGQQQCHGPAFSKVGTCGAYPLGWHFTQSVLENKPANQLAYHPSPGPTGPNVSIQAKTGHL